MTLHSICSFYLDFLTVTHSCFLLFLFVHFLAFDIFYSVHLQFVWVKRGCLYVCKKYHIYEKGTEIDHVGAEKEQLSGLEKDPENGKIVLLKNESKMIYFTKMTVRNRRGQKGIGTKRTKDWKEHKVRSRKKPI
jgi:hypothetical protein